MTKKHSQEAAVEKIVSDVLQQHLLEIKKDVVSRVLAEVPGLDGAAGRAGELLKTISAIHNGTNQRDILRILLDGVAQHCGRAALLLVKSGQITGWQGRGFDDELKDFAVDAQTALLARVLEAHSAVSAAASDMDHKFLKQFGKPADGRCVLLPLVMKDKVAALVYGDAGTASGGHLDAAAMELLVISTATWLELALARKAGRDADSTGEVPVVKAAAAAASAGPAFSDPFAAHAPAFSQSKALVEEKHQAVEAEAEAALAGLSPEDADCHRKAQRFARLLVDEIKLYNQPKVMEGRKNKDLYDRMREDIDKSRATYQKRYGNTVAGPADYFNQEVIRSLAEDDVSLLGGNFKR